MSPEDKYTSDGESQVRDIINKINEERPAQESSRESVIRKDGSKAVRVVRKRRVLVSEKDKKRHSRRMFMMGVFGVLSLLACFLMYFLWNLYRMSSQHSYEALASELRDAWGAESVELQGVVVTGFDLDVKAVTINFTTNSTSMIQSVTMTKVSGSLQKEAILSGNYVFDELTVGSATVVLRAGADQMKANLADIQQLVDVRRLSCANFNLLTADTDEQSAITLRDSELYMRYTDESNAVCSLNLEGGELNVRGWKKFNLADARLLITDTGIEELRAELALPEKLSASPEQSAIKPTLYLAGDIALRSSIYGPYGMDSKYMQLADFTEARLISFVSAQTRPNRVDGVNVMGAQVTFSPKAGMPSFRGEYLLQDVKWKNLPALQVIMRHLPADRRSQYVQLGVTLAKIELDSTPQQLRLAFDEVGMSENYSVTLKGTIDLDAEQSLSGTLAYGLPSALTRAEYPDGISDPVFQEIGELAWLNTTLSGTAFAPRDTSAELEQKAVEARKSRPKPFSLDSIDFDKLNTNLERLKEVESNTSAPRPTPSTGGSITPSAPTAPTTPSSTSTGASNSPLF